MKTSALTIRLDRALERQLAALAKRSGRSRSEIARDALRRQSAILQFEDARRPVMPFVELRRVLTVKFKVPADRIDAIEAVFAPFPIVPKPKKAAAVPVRDAADRWIVATAAAGNADVLVTGDRDLLDVQNELPVRTLGPRAFWELLRASQR